MNVGRRRDDGCIRHEFTNTFDIQRVFSRQQISQRIGDCVLALVSREFQNLHVHFVGDFLRMSGSQRIPRHAKTARRKHLFAIPVAGEGTRFSHQRINNMPIIDGRLVLADNSRHCLNQMAMMSHRDLFSTDAQIDELTNQPTRHGVRIGAHVDRAAATDANALDDVIGVEPLVRQSIQMCKILEELFSAVVVGSFDQLLDEGDVRFTSFKSPTAAQQQRLIDAILEMPVR